MNTNNDFVAAFISDRTLLVIGAIVCILLGLIIGLGFEVAHAGCCDFNDSTYLGNSSSSSLSSMGAYNPTPSSPVTIQPPVGLPSTAYRDSPNHITVTPPVGLPNQIYSNGNGVTTIQPPVGLPTYLYGGGR